MPDFNSMEKTLPGEGTQSGGPTSGGKASLVIIMGEGMNTKFMLPPDKFPGKQSFVFGRSTQSGVYPIRDKRVSREHFRISIDKDSFFIEDLGSTNGTMVNEKKVKTRTRLHNRDRVRAGSTVFKFLEGDIEDVFLDHLRDKINKDPLTGAYNRNFYSSYLDKKFAEVKRDGSSFHMAMLDIDFFKKINDKFGHQAGDMVLNEMGELILERLRDSDVFARIGGEEFALIILENDEKKALKFVRVLHKLIAGYNFIFEGKKIPVTLSIGMAAAEKGTASVDALVKTADDRLYQAKNTGRNRIVYKSKS